MTKAQLEAVIDALVEIVDGWNDAAVDEDRGRSHDVLCLTLRDDGGGWIGRRDDGNEVEDWHPFHDLDGLVRALADGAGIEFEG